MIPVLGVNMTDELAGAGPATSAMARIEMFPWWLVLLEGIVALILGFVLLFWPGTTLLLLVTFLGIYWFVTGIFALISVFIDRTRWGWKLLTGVLGIIAGIIVLAYPIYSAILIPALLTILIGVWGLIIGFVMVFQAFGGAGWGAGILGVLSIIFGLVILANPLVSTAVLIIMVAIFAIIGGISAIFLAFRLR
ncbi:MAG: DUF308 domain-containing protein [Methanomicrobiales archaeon]|nr:DUF308 domain-containing protein [Methanomicrobiales archaeon]